MDEKKLKMAMAKLPVKEVSTIPKDDEIVEGNDDGCHYKITKERLPAPFNELIFYYLSVSGPLENCNKLIQFY